MGAWGLRLLLSPLLVVQALWVIARAHRLPEAAGPRSGSTGTGPPLRLRIIGDSSAAGVGVAHQDDAFLGQLCALLAKRFSLDWHLHARTGATTRSTLTTLQSRQSDPADIVIVVLGVNDTTRLTPARVLRAQHRALLERVRVLHAPQRIYVTGIPPLGRFPLLPAPLCWTLAHHVTVLDEVRATEGNAEDDVTYLPFDLPLDPGLMASDGFHPSAAIYTLWAEKMASRVCTDWPET